MKPASHASRKAWNIRPAMALPRSFRPCPGHGFGNYANIFTTRKKTEGGAKPKGKSLDSVVARMKKANIVRGVVGRIPNSDLVRMVKKYPDNFICLAEFSAYDGMRGVRALEDIVRNHGIHGFRTSSLYTGLPASDRRYYPLYAKCVELDIPVRIYTAMNYANDRPYDLGHPRHLDQVAMDFPELRIVGGPGRLAVGQRNGRDCCAVTRTCIATPPRTGRVTSRTRLRLGDVPAIRQHAAAGQDHGRPVAETFGVSYRGVDRRIRSPAAERKRQGQMVLWQRRALLPDRMSAELGRSRSPIERC